MHSPERLQIASEYKLDEKLIDPWYGTLFEYCRGHISEPALFKWSKCGITKNNLFLCQMPFFLSHQC